jgi:hypothetical protein
MYNYNAQAEIDEMGKACSRNRRSALRALVRKPTRKRALGRPRCGSEDNIKMYIKEVGCCNRAAFIVFRVWERCRLS